MNVVQFDDSDILELKMLLPTKTFDFYFNKEWVFQSFRHIGFCEVHVLEQTNELSSFIERDGKFYVSVYQNSIVDLEEDPDVYAIISMSRFAMLKNLDGRLEYVGMFQIS